MTEYSFPFENADTTEEQFAKLFTRLADNGVASGLTVTATGGLGLSVAIGSAIVQGFFYENVTSAKALTVSTAHATYQRKDYVILKLDLAANSITAQMKAGTATVGGGTLPTLTQTASVWEYPIAIITVPAAAVSLVSANIENLLDRQSLRVFPYANTTARTRITPGSTQYALGVNTANRQLELWNGSTWQIISETTWDAITGKPSTFTPSAHTHDTADITSGTLDIARVPVIPIDKGGTNAVTAAQGLVNLGGAPVVHTHSIGNVTGLQLALDGKAATAHTHVAADVTSGTFATARIPNITVAMGGTGATNAADARTNLGVTVANIGAAAASHTHDYTNVLVSGYGNIVDWANDTKQAKGSYASASHTHALTSLTGSLNTSQLAVNQSWNMGSGTLTAATVFGNDANFSATLTASAGVYSTGVYNYTVGGPYRAVWIESGGRMGNTASARRFKQDIVDSKLSTQAALDLQLKNFRYIKDVEEHGDDAPVRIGLIAEDLLEIPGMEQFVFFDEIEGGKMIPAGIHYEWLALALIPLVQEQNNRLNKIEDRLSQLEK